MDVHVTRRSPGATRSAKRIQFGLAVLLAAIGVGVVRAEPPVIDQAAEAVSIAERILTTGEGLLFPIEPFPRCEVLNNYGGDSKSGQSGGHQGVDIGATEGQEVYAVEDGVLEEQLIDDPNSPAGHGWKLRVVAPDSSEVQYRYYHLAGFAAGLEEGSVVRRGQVIGWVGDTGNATPGGWHLHFEVRPGPALRSGSQPSVDPVPLLDIPSICNVY
jgi:murein DD-endopeptidase MepM/ murein hydrolase activator NlpD